MHFWDPMADTPTIRRHITVLGAGAWGTAMALALAERNDVLIWGRDGAAMHAIDAARCPPRCA